MKTLSALLIAFPLLTLPVGGAALARDDAAPAGLFERALESVQQHGEAVSEVCGFALQQGGEDGRTLRFADEAGAPRWYDSDSRNVDASEANLPEDGRRMIQIPPDRVLQTREAPVFIGWQDGLAVYRLRPPTLTVSGGGFTFDIADNVHADVGIDPQTATVRFREVRAPESFRPNAIVRIRGYETRIDMAPAWPDGPVVITSQRYEIAASAMLQNYDLNGDTRYSGFARCGG